MDSTMDPSSFHVEEAAFPMEEDEPVISLVEIMRQFRIDSMDSSDSSRSQSPFPEYKDEDDTIKASDMEKSVVYNKTFVAAMTENIRTNMIEPNVYAPIGQTNKKLNLLEDVKDHLAHAQLADSTRRRFIGLTNIIMRLQFILAKRNEPFIHPVDVEDAMELINTMLNYFTWVDNMLLDLVHAASNVSNVLSMLREDKITPVLKYQRMVSVVSAHLRQPRTLEEQLLTIFLAMYDGWIYNLFPGRRIQASTKEPVVDMGRLRITKNIDHCREKIYRATQSYASYRQSLLHIKAEFFPVVLRNMHVDHMSSLSADDSCEEY